MAEHCTISGKIVEILVANGKHYLSFVLLWKHSLINSILTQTQNLPWSKGIYFGGIIKKKVNNFGIGLVK